MQFFNAAVGHHSPLYFPKADSLSIQKLHSKSIYVSRLLKFLNPVSGQPTIRNAVLHSWHWHYECNMNVAQISKPVIRHLYLICTLHHVSTDLLLKPHSTRETSFSVEAQNCLALPNQGVFRDPPQFQRHVQMLASKSVSILPLKHFFSPCRHTFSSTSSFIMDQEWVPVLRVICPYCQGPNT